jgi:hypothetical protein
MAGFGMVVSKSMAWLGIDPFVLKSCVTKVLQA